MNADGSSPTRLTNNTDYDAFPAWSPDGTKIAFTTDRDGDYEVYTMNADGTDQTNITNNTAVDWAPAWSPDGTKIAFATNRDGDHEIYAMNADGTGQTRLTTNTASDEEDPAWSPNGTKIAFVTNRANRNEIFTMNPDGSSQTNITNDSGDDDWPAWSPDGTKIAFGTYRFPNSRWEIYRMNADGTDQTPLTNGSLDFRPDWSPDGTKIVFESDNNGIHVMNADGTNPTPLTNNTTDGDPSWQPIPYTGYPRPRGASPSQIFLVPAYKPCAAPNGTHGTPLAFPSCSPPQQTSDYLTVGTPDANGQAPKSIASVIYKAKTSNPEDLQIKIAISDVRRKADLSDYTGELQLNVPVRITDRFNGPLTGPGSDEPATVVNFGPFPVTFACAATADPTIGSACNEQTSINAVLPGAIVGGQRAIWELDQTTVVDGGPDERASSNDNTPFLHQGVFVP
jgi:Tol biopolymer transport system component